MHRAALLGVTAFLLSLAPAASAALPTGNLVKNPGAEQGRAPGSSANTTPFYWAAPAGAKNGTFVPYGYPGGFPTSAFGTFIHGGKNFFAGGSARRTSLLSQTVSLAPYASDIAAGNVRISATACLGGYADQNDEADLYVRPYKADGTKAVGGLGVKGPITADRQNGTILMPRSGGSKLGADARSLVVSLQFSTFDDVQYNDGYADNIGIVLHKPGTSSPPPECGGQPATIVGGGGGGSAGAKAGGTALVSKKVKRLLLGKRTASLKLRCVAHDGVCRGRVTLTARLRRHHKASTLGSKRFKIPAGRTRTVKVKLRRSARRRLARLSRRRLRRLRVKGTVRIGKSRQTLKLRPRRSH